MEKKVKERILSIKEKYKFDLIGSIKADESNNSIHKFQHQIKVSNEKIFIADCTNRLIYSYSLDGEYLFSIDGDTERFEEVDLSTSLSIDIDKNNLWVIDIPKKNILKFDFAGNFIEKFNLEVFIDSYYFTQIYCVKDKIYLSLSTSLATFPLGERKFISVDKNFQNFIDFNFYSEDKELLMPTDLTIDVDGNYYITDSRLSLNGKGQKIWKFNKDKVLIKAIEYLPNFKYITSLVYSEKSNSIYGIDIAKQLVFNLDLELNLLWQKKYFNSSLHHLDVFKNKIYLPNFTNNTIEILEIN